MENCHTRFWVIVAITAFFVVLIGLYISLSSLVRVEAKLDRVTSILNSWEIVE